MHEQPIILALDGLDLDKCLKLVFQLQAKVYAYKVHNLWDLHGPGIIKQLKQAGAARVWVDLKLKDIPNTVGLRAAAVKYSGADILSVHASGGVDMMAAAHKSGPEEIYGITVLTSLTGEQTRLIYGQSPEAAVPNFSKLAQLAGLSGIVCSAKEVGMLAKYAELANMKFVIPGVRSVGKDAGDQKRIDTPAAAIKAGATHLVIGRQITEAPDPVAAYYELMAEIHEANNTITEGGR